MSIVSIVSHRLWSASGWLMAASVAVSGCGPAPAPPVEEEEVHAFVQLTETQVAAAGIDSVQATPRTMGSGIVVSAVVEAVPDRTTHLSARVEGQLVGVDLNVGDQVSRGARLATIDAPEVGRTKADYLAALAQETVAMSAVERARRLFSDRITSERSLREAEAEATRAVAEREATEARLHVLGLSDPDLDELRQERHYGSTVELRSPLEGVVTFRSATRGASVAPNELLFTVMDLSQVWVMGDLYDTQLANVRTGQMAQVRTAAYPDRSFEGRVEQVGPTVESATRAAKVRVVVANPGLVLKPGMFATLHLAPSQESPAVLAVPRDAVQRDGQDWIVFVLAGPGRFERRVVVPGVEVAGYMAIATGLQEREWIATHGAFALKAEYRRAELGEGGHEE